MIRDESLRTASRTPSRTTEEEQPLLVDLSDDAAVRPGLVGGKAAALARGAVAGLATLPGVVLTTKFCDAIDGGAEVAQHPAVREAFERAAATSQALVARSSSVVEDTSASSMAGQFESVIGIRGYEAFVVAVDEGARLAAACGRHGAAPSPCSSNR